MLTTPNPGDHTVYPDGLALLPLQSLHSACTLTLREESPIIRREGTSIKHAEADEEHIKREEADDEPITGFDPFVRVKYEGKD